MLVYSNYNIANFHTSFDVSISFHKLIKFIILINHRFIMALFEKCLKKINICLINGGYRKN